jgi:hypothetical protein
MSAISRTVFVDLLVDLLVDLSFYFGLGCLFNSWKPPIIHSVELGRTEGFMYMTKQLVTPSLAEKEASMFHSDRSRAAINQVNIKSSSCRDEGQNRPSSSSPPPSRDYELLLRLPAGDAEGETAG